MHAIVANAPKRDSRRSPKSHLPGNAFLLVLYVMKDKVYIETSVFSYLNGRPSRDVVIAAHQELTRQWWETQSSKYELLISELVLEEAAGGDSDAAQQRIQAIRDLHILRTSESAVELATHLVSMRLTPQEYAADAMHIAIAAINGTD
jgi:hypothetical protein